jgi:ABC-type multidrug transport system fused ATPase/permease subunit
LLGAEAWLSKGSIKEAILFGLPYEEKRFNNALKIAEVSERSERALTKTRILAMNPAKWLQTKWLHSLLN